MGWYQRRVHGDSHLSMKVLPVLLLLAATVLYAQAQTVTCGAKTTSKSVTVEDGGSYTFKTQKGKKYKGNTKCTIEYKMGDSCAKMSFACTKFNTNNKDKKKCSKGDKVTVTANGKSKSYCKKKKPKVTSSGDMTVKFTSDAKKHSTGAVCKVTCTEAAATATTTTTTTGPAPTTERPFTKKSPKKGVVIPAWPRHKVGDFEAFSTISWWYNYHTYQNPVNASKWWCTDYDKWWLTNRTACFPEHGEAEWEYVPMVRGIKGRGYKPERFDADPSPAVENSEFVLGFNEPNVQDQSWLSPEEAAMEWIEHQNLHPDKTLVSPATGHADTVWMDQFMENCTKLGCRIDVLSTHLYNGAAHDRMAQLEAYSNRYGKKLWLTEFALKKTKNETEVVEFIREILPMLECADFIERYSWWYSRYYDDKDQESSWNQWFWISHANSLLDVSGSSSALTAAGQAYDFPYHNQPCAKTSGWFNGTDYGNL